MDLRPAIVVARNMPSLFRHIVLYLAARTATLMCLMGWLCANSKGVLPTTLQSVDDKEEEEEIMRVSSIHQSVGSGPCVWHVHFRNGCSVNHLFVSHVN
ncbi:hypothetical protein M0R45_025031 [Rubus argutus]|uniref:Secreted protein n=1 Tax=Rubus argutus TaxID=59490 RepID=A0AAW1WV34_RUBAR